MQTAPMDGTLYDGVARRVRELRVAAGLSQVEFAARASLNPKLVPRIEAGGQNLSLLTLGRMALALRCEAADLLAGVPVEEALLDPRPRRNARPRRGGAEAPSDG